MNLSPPSAETRRFDDAVDTQATAADAWRLLRELRILDTEPEAAFDAIARLAATQFGCPMAALVLIDRQRLWCKARVGDLPAQFPRDAGFDIERWMPADATIVGDTHDHAMAQSPFVVGAPHARFAAMAPLTLEGRRLGMLCCFDTRPHDPEPAAPPATLALLRDLSTTTLALLAARLNERRARLDEARVRTASIAASDWLWETDDQGRLTWTTHADARRGASSVVASVGEPWFMPYRALAGLRPADSARVLHAFSGRQAFDGLLTSCPGTAPEPGRPRVLSHNGRPVFDSVGHFKGFRGASRDVTQELRQRHTADHALAERQADLLESQSRLAAILAAVPDLWFVMDEQGRCLETNLADHADLAPASGDIRNRSVDELLPASMAQACRRSIARTLAGGGAQIDEYRVPVRGREVQIFESRSTPMPGRRVLFLARPVTELRALERHRLILERVIEAESAMPMAVLDAGTQMLAVTMVNRAFERLSGYTRDELIGCDLRTLQGDLMRQPGLAALGRGVARGRACTVQIQSRRKDGSRFTNEVHIAPVRNAQGRLTHFVCLLSDVTDRADTIDKLRVSEELYRSVAATMSDGMLVVMPDSRIVAANPAAAAIFGMPVESMVGGGAPWPFELRGSAQEPLAADAHPLTLAIESGVATEDRQFSVLRRDGSVRWIDFNCHPLRVTSEAARLPVLATFRDITDQRIAEQSLAVSEERWKFALEGAGQGVWDWNVRQGGFYMNDALKALLGFAPDEVGSTYEEWLARVHADDLSGVRQRLHAHLRMETQQFLAEHRILHSDGDWRWVVNRAKVVSRNADGRAERMVGTLADITARRHSETALRDKQAAELASRAKSEFLSRMSHEMRTPLNAVIGFSQLLLNHAGPLDARQVRDYMQHVLRAGEHLLSLINDVLDLQRVEEGRLLIDRRDVTLRVVAARVDDLLAATAQSHAVTLINDLDANAVVRADERLLRQVMLNVASNAIKYNRPGGTVRWSSEPIAGDRLAIHIDDTGAGLNAAQLARLFEPFERLGQETGAIQGTGIGLIIARRFCLAMGATLDVGSRVGHGTRATINLPMPLRTSPSTPPAPIDAYAAIVTTPHLLVPPVPAATPRPADVAPLRMLYVEDNRINAILFQAAFGDQTGFDLRLAENGVEALEQVEAWTPDVLVLDAHLPGMNGFELLEQLRHRPGLAEVPAFMCSADAMPEDIRRAADAGFNGYWPKPINFARIIDDLGKLGRHSTRFEARP